MGLSYLVTTLDILEQYLKELKYGQGKKFHLKLDSFITHPAKPGSFVKFNESIRIRTFNNHKVTIKPTSDGSITFIRSRRKSTDKPVEVKLCNPGSLTKIKRLLNF